VVTLQGVFTGLVGAAYVVPVLLKDAGLVAALDPLLEKNLAYLFGHQLANLNIYFAAAFVYALVAEHTGRPWSASRHVAVAWNLVLLLVLLPWPHHLYQDFAQPAFMPIAAEAVSFVVGIPSFLVTIFGALGRIHRSGMRWSVPMILVALGLWGWVTGGLGKRSVQTGAEIPFESALALERELQQQLFQSEDAKEGIAANVE